MIIKTWGYISSVLLNENLTSYDHDSDLIHTTYSEYPIN